MPLEAPPPTLRLSIDTEALAHNWRYLDALSGLASTGAAVKADCYGLGVDACVPILREAGCEAFFVAHWSEVEAVARHVPHASIAVLHGVINADEIAYAKAIGALPVINSLEQALAWTQAGGGRCHVMIDTGINRLGIAPHEASDDAVRALDIDILMSHLASADEDSGKNEAQRSAFQQASTAIAHQRTSLANSAGLALGEALTCDLTRPGLALYGGVPRPEMAGDIKQVAHIEAAILQVRELSSGDTVGYNAEFTATGPMRTATVSLGYADGFLRARGPGGVMLRGDAKLPIIGKVSMDMIVVDCANAPDLRAGDWLSVPFSLADAAQQSSVSQYELLTTIGNRLRA